MAKHAQTICRQIAGELFEFGQFVKLALKRLTMKFTFNFLKVNVLVDK